MSITLEMGDKCGPDKCDAGNALEALIRQYFGKDTKRQDASVSDKEFEDNPTRKALWCDVQDLVVYRIPLHPSLSEEAKGRILSPLIMALWHDLAKQIQQIDDDCLTTSLRGDLQLLMDMVNERFEKEMQSFENERKERFVDMQNRKEKIAWVAFVVAVFLSFLHMSKISCIIQ